MTAPWRACRAVAVISSTSWSKAAARLVDGDRGEALAPGPGSGSRRPGCRRGRPRPCGRRSAATRTESASLGSTTTSAAPQAVIASSSSPVDGRRPGPPATTTAPASSKSAARPGPGGDRDDPAARTARRARRPRCRLGDLLGEVGDPDPVRPAGLDAGLDRRADVVDVHVDVPQALAADDDERVAEPRRASSRSAGIALVARRRGGTSPRRTGPSGGEVARARRPDRDRDRVRVPSGAVTGTGRRPVSTVSAASRITLSPRPPASTTPASRQRRQLLRRAGQRLAGRGGRGGEDVAGPGAPGRRRACAAASAAARRDGEDGALDRGADRGVAGVGGADAARRPSPRRSRSSGPACGDPAAIAPQHLAQDHPGVAARAEQRAAAEGGRAPCPGRRRGPPPVRPRGRRRGRRRR